MGDKKAGLIGYHNDTITEGITARETGEPVMYYGIAWEQPLAELAQAAPGESEARASRFPDRIPYTNGVLTPFGTVEVYTALSTDDDDIVHTLVRIPYRIQVEGEAPEGEAPAPATNESVELPAPSFNEMVEWVNKALNDAEVIEDFGAFCFGLGLTTGLKMAQPRLSDRLN